MSMKLRIDTKAATLGLLGLLSIAPGFAAQGFREKLIYFGDVHWHSCLSQDAEDDTTLTGQYESMLRDYGLDFSMESDHAEAAEAGILECDKYLPLKNENFPFPYFDNELATAMKQAADDWNGMEHGSIRFVTFPGYEWAPDSRCWMGEPFGDDSNSDNYTPGHINYFFSDTVGWSYGPDVWEPGSGDGDLCEVGTDTGVKGYYNGSRDWMDEILGQLIHQRDDPDRSYDLLIQYNHPAATVDKGGSTDHVAKWFDLEHSDTNCSVKPGGVPCTSENQCETLRRAYGVTSVEWYASHEASIGSTEVHSFNPFGIHDAHHLPGRFVASRGLQEGFTLASFGGSDSHGGRRHKPTEFNGDRGAGSASLTAVYAGDATRPAIWDGLSRRRTYTLSRFRGVGPVHKGRVDFFSPDPVGIEQSPIGSFPALTGVIGPTTETGMGGFAGTLPLGSAHDFTIAAAHEHGTTGVYPMEVRLYVVGINTPLSYRTDIEHYWLDDVPGDLGKLGVLLGRALNPTAALEFTHTFKNIHVNPGDAVFAIVIYSDAVWADDYYDSNKQKLDADGDGAPDESKSPYLHSDNNTWARTTPIWFHAENERARQTALCSGISFAGSGVTDEGAAGAGDAGLPGDAGILPVAQEDGYRLEWNQWLISVPADTQFADLSFFTQKDEDSIGHLFAVRIDGQLLYSGRAGINHEADALVEMKNLPFPLRKGLHKIEVHMDDQEYALETSDNYHCNDYDGPPGYVDAVVFHNGSGDACHDVTPPAITCPADVTAECSAFGGAPASNPAIEGFLAAASATDAVDPDPTITHDAPAFFPTGSTEVTFTATDDAGNSASCTAVVTVADTTPPEITSFFGLVPAVLSPPRHDLITIAVPAIVSADVCDAAPRILCGVESDEAADGTDDGSTSFDIVFDGEEIATQGTGSRDIVTSAGSGTFSLRLRAERSGISDGRTYRATCVAVDAGGARSQPRTATVEVPLNGS